MIPDEQIGAQATQLASWQLYRQQQLPRTLERFLHLARTDAPYPKRLQPHFRTLLNVIEAAREWPDCGPLIVELAQLLRPWPPRWGYADGWLSVLHLAADMSRQMQRPDMESEFLAYQAELLMATNQLPAALEVGNQAIGRARLAGYAPARARASYVVYELLVVSGHTAVADQIAQDVVRWWDTAVPPANSLVAAHFVTLVQSRALRRRGQYQEALSLMWPLMAALENAPELDAALPAQASANLGWLYLNSGHHQQAAHYLQQAVDFYVQVGDEAMADMVRGDLAWVYWAQGQFARAEPLFLAAITRAEKQEWHELAEFVGNLAAMYMAQGKLQQARPYLERQVELAQRSGQQREIIRATINRGATLLLLGEYTAGLVDVHPGLAYYQAQNHAVMALLCQMSIAFAYWGMGQRAEGLPLAEEVLNAALTRFPDLPFLTLFARRCLALFRPPTEAAKLVQEALTQARELRLRLQEAACLLSLSGLALDEGERQMLWHEGVRLLQEMDALAWLEGSPHNPPFIGMFH